MALKYMPDVKNKEAECPIFDNALAKCFCADDNSREKIDAIWRFIAASLYADHPFQYMYYFWGDGGDGKSAISEVIAHCVGKKNVSSVTLKTIANGGYGLSDAVSSNINTSAEAKNPDLFMSENIKAITGGDMIEVRQIHQAPQYVRAICKILIFTNKFPEINENDDSPSGTRRFVPIAFTHNFTEDGTQDITIISKMKAERDGIIMKALSKMDKYLQSDMVIPVDTMKALQSDFNGRRAERGGIMEFFLSDYIKDHVFELNKIGFEKQSVLASELFKGFMSYQKDYLADKYKEMSLTLFGRERRKIVAPLLSHGIKITENRATSGLMVRYDILDNGEDGMNGFKIINNK
jgi:putative DNA primase/helicase